MKKLLAIVGTAVVLLVGFSVVLTARYVSTQSPAEPAAAIVVAAGAGERLSGAIRIPTVSAGDAAAFDAEPFRTLHAYLAKAFPLVHSHLRRETVGSYSLLYTWTGTDPSADPILLIGHMDVVPIEPGTERKWAYDPFGGRIVDGFIWGRGATDNKSAVLGTLEAVEMLLAEGFRPSRTVLLAYGHDEEVGGLGGAREIAALLKRRGVRPALVLDEGGVIGDGVLAGVRAPVALVGVAEKGFVTLELTARTAGGHSSLPPPQGAVGILSAAIARLEQNPMPARLDGATRQMFDYVGPQFPALQRALFANLWLTRPLVVRRLQKTPATNAMVRTTTAPTIFQAGTKDNVLPTHARAVINFRILPGDSIDTVTEHVSRVVDDDRIEIKVGGRFSAEPSRVSPVDSEAFRVLQRTIRSIVPEAVVAPYLVVVVTDARHYADLSGNIFRFLPLRLDSADLKRLHGIDERLGIRDYETAIRIYRQLLVNGACCSQSGNRGRQANLGIRTIG
jgi:carboxypeptidase PM20D1